MEKKEKECLVLRLEEVVDLLDVSEATVKRWVKDGYEGFPAPIALGRRRVWRREDIERWVAKRPPCREAS